MPGVFVGPPPDDDPWHREKKPREAFAVAAHGCRSFEESRSYKGMPRARDRQRRFMLSLHGRLAITPVSSFLRIETQKGPAVKENY